MTMGRLRRTRIESALWRGESKRGAYEIKRGTQRARNKGGTRGVARRCAKQRRLIGLDIRACVYDFLALSVGYFLFGLEMALVNGSCAS